MAKGIIYVMTTAVDGLVKIGKTGIDNYEQRMYNLEHNGYYNVATLRRAFAIEVNDYDEKEKLLDEIFSKSRVSNSELFSLKLELVIQLLASLDGRVVYPVEESKSEMFAQATDSIESSLIPDGEYTLKTNIKSANMVATGVLKVEHGRLIVLKGAYLGPVTNLPASWNEFRNSIECKGNITLSNFECTSPSMAAAIVLGHRANGWKTWKNKNGQLIDIYRHKNIEDE